MGQPMKVNAHRFQVVSDNCSTWLVATYRSNKGSGGTVVIGTRIQRLFFPMLGIPNLPTVGLFGGKASHADWKLIFQLGGVVR